MHGAGSRLSEQTAPLKPSRQNRNGCPLQTSCNHVMASSETGLRCGLCNRIYKNKKLFVKHLQSHDKPAVFSCQECGKTFLNRNRLKRHSLIHSGDLPHKCTKCLASFATRFQCKLHERRHTGEKPHNCDVCPKSFSSSSGLKRHKLTHTKETSFICTHCCKGFSQMEKLKQHERIHTGERPFMCDRCPKTFRTRNTLVRHLRIHSGETFRCLHCPKAFGELYALKKHHKVKHREISFSGGSNRDPHSEQQNCNNQNNETNFLKEINVAKSGKVKGRLSYQSKVKQNTESPTQKSVRLTQVQNEDVDGLHLSIGQQDFSTVLDENGWHRIPLPAASDLLYRNMEHISESDHTNVRIPKLYNKSKVQSENTDLNCDMTSFQSTKKLNPFTEHLGNGGTTAVDNTLTHYHEMNGIHNIVCHGTGQDHSARCNDTMNIVDCSRVRQIPDTGSIGEDGNSDGMTPMSVCTNKSNPWEERKSLPLAYSTMMDTSRIDTAPYQSFPPKPNFNGRSDFNTLSNHHGKSMGSNLHLYHFHSDNVHGGNHFDRCDYQPIYQDLSPLEEAKRGNNKGQNSFQENTSASVSNNMYQPDSHSTLSHLDVDGNKLQHHQPEATRNQHQTQEVSRPHMNNVCFSYEATQTQFSQSNYSLGRNAVTDTFKLKSCCHMTDLEPAAYPLHLLREEGQISEPSHQPKHHQEPCKQFQNMKNSIRHSSGPTYTSMRHDNVNLPEHESHPFISSSGESDVRFRHDHLCQSSQLHPCHPSQVNPCQPPRSDSPPPSYINQFQNHSSNPVQFSGSCESVMMSHIGQSFYSGLSFDNTHSSSDMRESGSIPFSAHIQPNQMEPTRDGNPGLTVSLIHSSSNPSKQQAESPSQKSLSEVPQQSVSSVESDQLSQDLSWNFNASVTHFDSLSYQNLDNKKLDKHPGSSNSKVKISAVTDRKETISNIQQFCKQSTAQPESSLKFENVFSHSEKSAHKQQKDSEVKTLTPWDNIRLYQDFDTDRLDDGRKRKLEDGICQGANYHESETDDDGRIESYDGTICRPARLDPVPASLDADVSGARGEKNLGMENIGSSLDHSEISDTKSVCTAGADCQRMPKHKDIKQVRPTFDKCPSDSLNISIDRNRRRNVNSNDGKAVSSVHKENTKESKTRCPRKVKNWIGTQSGNQKIKNKKHGKIEDKEKSQEGQKFFLSGRNFNSTNLNPKSEEKLRLLGSSHRNSTFDDSLVTNETSKIEDKDSGDQKFIRKKKRKLDRRKCVAKKRKYSDSELSHDKNNDSQTKTKKQITKPSQEPSEQNLKLQAVPTEQRINDFMESHCKTDQDKNKGKCLKCNKEYKNVRYLRNHILAKHLDLVKPQCDICQKTFPNPSRLKRHIKTHSSIKEFPCTKCHQTFTAKKYLVNHLKRHDRPSQPFVCEECGQTFPRRQQLNVHCRIHSGEKPYKCSHCMKQFATSFQVKLHERIHTGDRPYKCSFCNKHFKSHSNLTVHVRRHKNERPYVCLTCNSAFYEASKLKAHMRVHTGALPYTCKQCHKSFRVKHQLVQHMRWHTGKTFNCQFCPKAFDERWILRSHLKKQHPDLTVSNNKS